MERFKAAVLGATGSVGQKLVRRLGSHPWFELTTLVASQRSAGRPYREVAHWLEPSPMPRRAAELVVRSLEPWCPESSLSAKAGQGRRVTDELAGVDVVFSALDRGTAREAEPLLAARGCRIVSNASALRMDPAVPLLIPEINPGHLELLEGLPAGAGSVVTNPNCATVGLALVLKPLDDAFGVRAAQVTTLQAISGAGYPGVPSLDILGNVLPEIPGEEAKIETESAKILGSIEQGRVEAHPLVVSAQSNRVPTLEGHVLCISVRLGETCTPNEAAAALSAFSGDDQVRSLPSAPERPLRVLDDAVLLQPRLHSGLGNGMVVSIGRIRPCPVLGLRLVALVHNTERGAAGAAVLNAELMARRGLLGDQPASLATAVSLAGSA